jgi:hypothetical protein
MKYFKEIESNVGNNNALLDEVKKLAQLVSDAALAKALNDAASYQQNSPRSFASRRNDGYCHS